MTNQGTGLTREIGLVGLAATGICSMMGAAINVVPIMIQRNVPGIGPHVIPAYLLASVPAILAAMAYSILGSAMPRAGGSYIYASRGLNPYLGFVASFSQWFGLSIAIGVVSYVMIPFMRDISTALGWINFARILDIGSVRVVLSLVFLWFFVFINLRGVQLYERTLIPLMFLMFVLGSIVIVAGFSFDHNDFASAVSVSLLGKAEKIPLTMNLLLPASAVLFSTFIGFDSIAQAGGEAKNPGRNIPLATGIAVLTVGSFYILFTAAVYHAVPWNYIAENAQFRDLTAPGLLGVLLSPAWTVAIIAGAVVALINDLPAMLLAVSRLMFAWSEDGIFPKAVATVNSRWHTPHIAILLSGAMATIGILGSHLAGDFFIGVDILVTSMLVNFLLMCVSVLTLPSRNKDLAAQVKVFPSRAVQIPLAITGVFTLFLFLVVHIWKDLSSQVEAWYLHSTYIWIIVLTVASLIYFYELASLVRKDVDVRKLFSTLPIE